MSIYNTYIQQIHYDGSAYTKGAIKDLLGDFKIACQEFPFKKSPQVKDIPSNDWFDEDGLDVYIPHRVPLKHYDIEATFLYKGTDSDIRTDLMAFVDFLRGMNAGAVGSTLAIYNEYVGFGRKDVVVSEIGSTLFYTSGDVIDALAQFKVKFTVYDPVTDVTLSKTTTNGVTAVTGLNW